MVWHADNKHSACSETCPGSGTVTVVHKLLCTVSELAGSGALRMVYLVTRAIWG
jgi:hypothetical protein